MLVSSLELEFMGSQLELSFGQSKLCLRRHPCWAGKERERESICSHRGRRWGTAFEFKFTASGTAFEFKFMSPSCTYVDTRESSVV